MIDIMKQGLGHRTPPTRPRLRSNERPNGAFKRQPLSVRFPVCKFHSIGDVLSLAGVVYSA